MEIVACNIKIVRLSFKMRVFEFNVGVAMWDIQTCIKSKSKWWQTLQCKT